MGKLQSKLDDKTADFTEARRLRDNHNRTIRRIKKGGGGKKPESLKTPVREAKRFIQYQKSKRARGTRIFVVQVTVNIKLEVIVSGEIAK